MDEAGWRRVLRAVQMVAASEKEPPTLEQLDERLRAVEKFLASASASASWTTGPRRRPVRVSHDRKLERLYSERKELLEMRETTVAPEWVSDRLEHIDRSIAALVAQA